MSMSRCTCIYRASSAAEQRSGSATIAVKLLDPWCPAMPLHAQVSQPPVIAVVEDGS